MSTIHIRPCTLSDVPLLQRIARQTFRETFAADNDAADLEQYLTTQLSETQLRAEAGNPESFFYVAENGVTVVGYLKLNIGEAQTEWKGEKGLEIERIYVLAAHQGQRIGQQLYEKALSVARSRNAPYVSLGVWERNTKAIRFYEKNGFTVVDKHIFYVGTDAQTDFLMKLPLSPTTTHNS